MLIPQNLSPDDCVYYNAAYVLESLLKRREQSMPDLYCDVRQHHEMSFSMFILCLDWLFLINSIRINEELITLCS